MLGLFSPYDPFHKFLAIIEYDPCEDDTHPSEKFETYTGWVMDRPDWWPGWEAAGITRKEVLLDLAQKADTYVGLLLRRQSA